MLKTGTSMGSRFLPFARPSRLPSAQDQNDVFTKGTKIVVTMVPTWRAECSKNKTSIDPHYEPIAEMSA